MDRNRRWSAPRTAATVAGIVLAGVTLVVHGYLASFEHDHGLAARFGVGLWILGGAFLFGALPGYVSARYRLVSPALAAALLYALTLVASWSAMVASAGSAGGGITSTVFEIGLWYWPVALGLPLAVGALEYVVRYAAGGRLAPSMENRI